MGQFDLWDYLIVIILCSPYTNEACHDNGGEVGMTSMSAREITAAFEKNRTRRKLGDDNGIALLLFEAAPVYLQEHPEWLEKEFTAATACELQIELLVMCRDDKSLLRMIYDNSAALQSLFTQNVRRSALDGAFVVATAMKKIDELLHGMIIPKLDQAVCMFRDMSKEDEREYFVKKGAHWRVLRAFDANQLTFRIVIERSPHLLVLRWHAD